MVLAMCMNKDEISAKVEAKVNELAMRGIRSLSVAVGPDVSSIKMFGILTFLDPPRPDTKSTIHAAAELGVDVKMITGDHAVIAKETCRQLDMGQAIFKADGLPQIRVQDGIPQDLGEKYGAQIESANGFAEVFPEHKFMIVEAMRQREYTVGMTGDGVNDAPALKVADVGIAVEGATDAARAAADLILTEPGLSVIVDAIRISRCIFQRMKNYVIYRVACTIQLLMFFFITVLAFKPDTFDGACKEYKLNDDKFKGLCGLSFENFGANLGKENGVETAHDYWSHGSNDIKDLTGFECDDTNIDGGMKFYMRSSFHHCGAEDQPSCTDVIPADQECGGKEWFWCNNKPCESDDIWQSTFELPVLTLVIITILNDGTIISIAYDHVIPSKNPELWTLPVLYMVASLLGLTAMVSSIALLYIALDARSSDSSVGHTFGLADLHYQQVLTLIYLKISLSDFLTVFSARTQGPFFDRKPGTLLGAAAIVAMISSSILSGFWPFGEMKPIEITQIVFVWVYCLLWWFLQDFLKFMAYKLIYKYDVMGVRTQVEKKAPTLSGNKARIGEYDSV